ncbi:phosphoribosyl-AMP cyclohydrolase [Micromonospora yangpuensis]|uniref:Phosphoribosyl-AMP cyclohydrolase n=1 Tax=Micromonospora yangpuensis TaxID=683228 RepID=A0A1C6UZC2_9ACTN|nr:phosphoribosyl-AMP cyclohydrolase [Micromonospora yangpuensis]
MTGAHPSPPGPTPAGAARGSRLDPAVAARLKRDADGLVAAVVRQYDSGEVLMVGWMDDEALHLTLTTGRATYWSRSRQEYWVKGDTSGHHQYVHSVALDCDGDALLVSVDQVGAACHTGDRTCFHTELPVTTPADQRPSGSAADQRPSGSAVDGQPSGTVPQGGGS